MSEDNSPLVIGIAGGSGSGKTTVADADPDLRFIRHLQRDISEWGRTRESVIHQFLTAVRPMHLEFVESSKRYADINIPEGGMVHIVLENS